MEPKNTEKGARASAVNPSIIQMVIFRDFYTRVESEWNHCKINRNIKLIENAMLIEIRMLR